MKEDGRRLAISITDTSFSIIDVLTGESIIYDKGVYVNKTLPVEAAEIHFDNIQEALMTYKAKRKWRIDGLATNKSLVIRTNNHFDWTISTNDGHAQLVNNYCKHTKGFNKFDILNKINHVRSILLNVHIMLNPKRDIVRRIVDVGALFWRHEGHSILTYEQYVSNDFITNCLVDGIFHEMVFVNVSKSENNAEIRDKNLELLFTTPLDDSILLFHSENSKLFTAEV